MSQSRFCRMVVFVLLAVIGLTLGHHEDMFKYKCRTEITHCEDCYDPIPYCTRCRPPYHYVDDDGECTSSQETGCMNYTEPASGPPVCSACSAGYTLYNTHRPADITCYACSDIDIRCTACSVHSSSGAPLCDDCSDGYAVEQGGHECRSCPSFCDVCSYDDKTTTDAVLCDICDPGRALSADKRSCNGCPSYCHNCTEVSGSVLCDDNACYSNYARSQDRTSCLACSLLDIQCTACTDSDNGVSPDVCIECAPGYGVKYDEIECEPCIVNKCIKCTDTNTTEYGCETCIECEGYEQYFGQYYPYTLAKGGANNGECLQCPNRCATCSDRDSNSVAICSQCDEGYTVSNDGQLCIPCSALDYDCLQCSVNSTDHVVTCQECRTSAGLSKTVLMANEKGCTDCPVGCFGTCTDANSDGTPECSECAMYSGLVNSNSDCRACSSSNNLRMDQCMRCSSSNSDNTLDRCSECNHGFIPKSDNSGCLECRDHLPGCESCSISGGNDNIERCSACKDRYALKANMQGCTACSRIKNCVACTDADSNGVPECTVCIFGSTLQISVDGTQSCVLDCSDVDYYCDDCAQPPTHCHMCKPGFVLAEDTMSCTAGCYECENSSDCAAVGKAEKLMRGGMCNLESPNHGCWVYKIPNGSGKDVFRRGCGNSTCPATADGTECKSRTVDGKSVEECGQCCLGSLCNDFDVHPPSGVSVCTWSSVLILLLLVVVTVMQ